MSFEDFQKQIQKNRSSAEQLRERLKSDRQALGNISRKRKQLVRQVSDDDIQRNKELIKLNTDERTLRSRVAQGKAGYAASLAAEFEGLHQYIDFTNPINNLSNLKDDTPILLFPLRLETRFKKIRRGDTTTDQLWVRVFPDDIAIDSFERDLSSTEIRNLRRYWINRWKAGKTEEGNRAAWRNLASSHGPGRAWWLIQQFVPDNIAVEPEIQNGEIILVIPVDTLPSSDQRSALDKYWTAVWKANKNNTDLNNAWSELISDLGSEPAAQSAIETWVPANINDLPPTDFDFATTAVKIEFLDFPLAEEIDTKIHAWSQPPRTTILPERFVLLCYRAGELDMEPQLGNVVAPNLILGPDPAAEEGEDFRLASKEEADADPNIEEGDLIFSEHMRWMFDFDEAISKGLGFKVNLTPDQAANGFDRVLVLGVKLGADKQTARQKVEELFEHHHHSRKGMGILKQGTPTNNTEEDNAGYSWRHDADESFNQYFKSEDLLSDSTDWFSQTDGRWLSEMLGLDPEKLQYIDNFSQKDICEGLAMQRALWPATMGHFMQSMMNPIFSDETIEDTRQFFKHYVSGRGCVPAIRVGNQPYGIFPTTNFTGMRWFLPKEPGPLSAVAGFGRFLTQRFGEPQLSIGFLSYLYSILMDMNAIWKNKVADVSHVGKSGDAHQILLDIVGLHPNSVDLVKRYANSVNQIWNIYALGGNYYPQVAAVPAEYGEQAGLLYRLGYPLGAENPSPKIFEKVFFDKAWNLYGDRIDKVPNTETDPISAYTNDGRNYIKWLITAAETSHDALRKQLGFTDNKRPNTLLYLLMYHALDLSYVDTSLKLKLKAGVMNREDYTRAFVEPEFIQIQQGKENESRWKHIYKAHPEITGNPSMMLSEYIALNLQTVDEATAFRDALDGMKQLAHSTTASLERLMLEHIDTVSYRHDAWLSGLTSLQLELMRKPLSEEEVGDDAEDEVPQATRGIYLGAYGWLEDLRPENKVLTTPPLSKELDDIFNRDKDLKQDSENAGFILTPSQNHAVTAAVLRNGNKFFEDEDDREQLNIKLSSERVRVALQIIEGMQAGQSLAALLGYQFERGLHDRTDAEVDQFILDIRNQFPLVAKKVRATTPAPDDPDYESISQIEARNVLDGVAFLEHLTESENYDYPFGLDLPSAEVPQELAINDEVKRLIDINDAVADLALAESVHQVVMGNYERASAVLNTYSKGNFPPTPDVIKTPRSGPVLTHRVGLQFKTGLTNDINDSGVTPRMVAEPAMQDWLSGVLPPLNSIVLVFHYIDATASNPKSVEIAMSDLGLSALDLLYLVAVDSEQAMTTLDDLVTQYALTDPGIDFLLKEDVNIEYAGKINADNVSVFEINALLGSLRDILLRSRYLKPGDVKLPNESGTKDKVVLDLPQSRVTTIISKLDDLNTAPLQVHIDRLAALIASENIDDMIDDLLSVINDTRSLFVSVSRFGLLQTGIGFIYQWHQGMLRQLFAKLTRLHQRWQDKLDRYASLLDDYNNLPLADIEARFVVLQKMELVISTAATPISGTPEDFYSNHVVPKYNAFLDKFNLDLVPLISERDLGALYKNTKAFSASIGDFDLTGIDIADELKQLGIFIADLHTGSSNLSAEITKKTTAAQTSLAQVGNSVDAIKNIELIIQASKAIFGENFVMVPEFSVGEEQATEWQNALADSTSLMRYLESDLDIDFPLDDWFHGVSRVREKMQALENSFFHLEGFGAAELPLTATQFPYREQDYWLALQFPKTKEASDEPFIIDEDKLLYTAIYSEVFNPAKNQCGLLLDDWTEMIPSKDETVGLSFHYDQPNSEPPQALLLALPSDFRGTWQWQDLVDILHSTLDMAKQRAVEPDHIDASEYSLFLPTIVSLASPMPLTATLNLALNNEVYYAPVVTND